MKKNQLRGIERFTSSIMEETKPIIEELSKDEKIFEVMKNVIFDEPGSRYAGIAPTQKERVLQKFLYGISEIDSTFQVLQDIPFYLKQTPRTNSNISKSRFLKYHVGNYLNENYILRERLLSYQKVVTRMYKNDHRVNEMKVHVARLEVLLSGFNGIVTTRGRHVHQERYNDEDFDRLSIYELMTKEDDLTTQNVLKRLYPLAIREYRKKWVKIISDNNKAIKEILDKYFDILYEVVFDKNGKWISPNRA